MREPLDGADGSDYGAHGVFGNRAAAHSPQRWLAEHTRPWAWGVAGVAPTLGNVAMARHR
ncbi:hypothetical protein [Gordonia sp. YY1]|uniref:hypothetical protein n=1 Tax=Gordonia sp. YY1 TaxID=396712 RepID=UPI0013311BE0|nr:hypothetical protein [Gordonia sp. YY1]